VPENHDALALPLGVQHVGEVGAACTQNAAMCPEWLSVHDEDHVAVDALFQKPGEGGKGVLIAPHLASPGQPQACCAGRCTQPRPAPALSPAPPTTAPASCSPLQEVVVVIPSPAGGGDLLVVAQGPADGIAQRPVEAALAVKGVGLATGSWGGRAQQSGGPWAAGEPGRNLIACPSAPAPHG
jgi:hypothetical protein